MTWKVNRSKPVSLDYTDGRGYQGDSLTGTAYWVRLSAVRDEAGLNDWLGHLSGKSWFDAYDFLSVRQQALRAGL
jgi:hypothetical protein